MAFFCVCSFPSAFLLVLFSSHHKPLLQIAVMYCAPGRGLRAEFGGKRCLPTWKKQNFAPFLSPCWLSQSTTRLLPMQTLHRHCVTSIVHSIQLEIENTTRECSHHVFLQAGGAPSAARSTLQSIWTKHAAAQGAPETGAKPLRTCPTGCTAVGLYLWTPRCTCQASSTAQRDKAGV